MATENDWQDRNLANYCVAFVDLLGQKRAMSGQRLLPVIATPEERNAFLAVAEKTVFPIRTLQNDFDVMMAAMQHHDNSPLRAALPDSKKATWDQAMHTKVRRQNWSDGLMLFKSLEGETVNANAFFEMFMMCGGEALIFLARGFPLRGAIDLGWGIEWKDGELVGPAVACAYQLESEVAKYPRIVVGQHVIELLKLVASIPDTPATTDMDKVNRFAAQQCLKMIWRDPTDNCAMIHFLGDVIRAHVTQHFSEVYDRGLAFIKRSLSEFQQEGNAELTRRYERLLAYYEAHPL